jgi:phosphoenolpyruvate-protein kinase (PTS system EI component)
MTIPITQVTKTIALVIALMPLVSASQTAERNRTQGLKETDRFIKAGGTTSQRVAQAKNQVKSTLSAYNTLVTQPSKNLKGDYKRLMKSTDSMNDAVADARQKITEMQTAGDAYFSGRAETIKNIQDSQLQTRAQQRLEDNRKRFAEVLQGLREAGEALEPFRKQLADQVTYLGSDLTPSAIASLKPEADKLNKQGEKVFSRADGAIARANEYFKSLRAAES